MRSAQGGEATAKLGAGPRSSRGHPGSQPPRCRSAAPQDAEYPNSPCCGRRGAGLAEGARRQTRSRRLWTKTVQPRAWPAWRRGREVRALARPSETVDRPLRSFTPGAGMQKCTVVAARPGVLVHCSRPMSTTAPAAIPGSPLAVRRCPLGIAALLLDTTPLIAAPRGSEQRQQTTRPHPAPGHHLLQRTTFSLSNPCFLSGAQAALAVALLNGMDDRVVVGRALPHRRAARPGRRPPRRRDGVSWRSLPNASRSSPLPTISPGDVGLQGIA